MSAAEKAKPASEVLGKRLDTVALFRLGESTPLTLDGATLLACAQLVEAEGRDSAGAIQLLLDPEEIAAELGGLADICHAIGCIDTADRAETLEVVGRSLRRLAARVGKLRAPTAAQLAEEARRYVVCTKDKAVPA